METGIGDTLRGAREAQGRTYEDAAHALRLRAEQVRALEEERFGSFGGDVYARGFLKSYAVELGLDPQPLLDTYRREVSGADPIAAAPLAASSGAVTGGRRGAGGGGTPAWVGWVVATVVVLAGLALVGQLAGSRAPEQASPEPAPPVAPTEEEDAEAEGEPEPEPEPEPEVEAPSDPVELFLALEANSWMRVTVDGTVVFEQEATQGETLRFSGDEAVIVRYGNAGGVRVELNGEDLGVPGSSGSVVEVEYTPDGQSEA